MSDWDDTKIYAYDLDTGNRLADKDIDLAGSNDAPPGITGEYNAILVVDKDDSYVYAYSQYDGSRRGRTWNSTCTGPTTTPGVSG